MAPEVICVNDNKKNTYDARCDVWSIGIMAYVMMIGKLPIEHDTYQRIKKALTSWDPHPSKQNDPLNQYSRAFSDPQFIDLENENPPAGEFIKKCLLRVDQPDN